MKIVGLARVALRLKILSVYFTGTPSMKPRVQEMWRELCLLSTTPTVGGGGAPVQEKAARSQDFAAWWLDLDNVLPQSTNTGCKVHTKKWVPQLVPQLEG